MHIRPAQDDDRGFILSLAARLIEFGRVPGREPAQMLTRDRAVLAKALDEGMEAPAIFIAEEHGRPVGFIHLTIADDYYTDRDTGHIADVVVAEAAGGRGVGSALIAYAEEWARQRGYTMLTLNVFTANRRARELYARMGFEEEWIRCIKRLQP